MKTTSFMTMSLLFHALTLFAQHIPVEHTHITSICFGYATARAFGKSWNDPICPARDLYKNSIDETHFTRSAPFSLSDLEVGDIIEFGIEHVAYVSKISNKNMDGVEVDQVDGEGKPEQKELKLRWVVDGHCNPWVQAHGGPTGYYRKRKENSFLKTLDSKKDILSCPPK